MSIVCNAPVNIALVRQAPPTPMRGTVDSTGAGITNAEHKMVMCALATDRPGRLECQAHGTRRTRRTGQASHGRMV